MSSYRRITRWEHERILEAMQRRLDRKPTHFLTRGLAYVNTEVSPYVLAYKLRRVIKLLGMPKTMQAMQLAGA